MPLITYSVGVRRDMWTDFLFKLDIDALEFIQQHCDGIVKVCGSEYEESQVMFFEVMFVCL